MKSRYGHSLTATNLGPGLTEVLMFGGKQMRKGASIAETTILRFGEGLEITATVAFSLVYGMWYHKNNVYHRSITYQTHNSVISESCKHAEVIS